MQLKTVSKIIKNKMEEWLQTLPDEALRNDVKKNLLVSGGSILSLLLNEKVNDYDVYLKDMDVLLRLTEHYAKFAYLTVLDGRRKEQYVGDLEDHINKDIEEMHGKYMTQIRNLKPDQIKILIYGGGHAHEYDETKTYQPKFFSPNAISLTDDVQIVCRFHGTADEIHKTFDFIHATNYFTMDEGLVTNKPALESILTRQLKYQGSFYPLTSIIRMKKFIKRNWNITAGEILKIMFQISELDLKNPDVLAEQLVGVDVAYFGVLLEILQGVDKEAINSHYLNTLIDRVFDSAEETE